MANSWKFMLKKNQLTCFLFDMNFHKYSMNFHKLLYSTFASAHSLGFKVLRFQVLAWASVTACRAIR